MTTPEETVRIAVQKFLQNPTRHGASYAKRVKHARIRREHLQHVLNKLVEENRIAQS